MAAQNLRLDESQFAQISKALAEPSRVEMLKRIGKSGEAPTCSDICHWLNLAPATISHHLKELESAGLIATERRGKFAYIFIQRDVLKAYLKHLASI